jgi:hypothetical protein
MITNHQIIRVKLKIYIPIIFETRLELNRVGKQKLTHALLPEISAPFFFAFDPAKSPPTIFSFLTTFFTALLKGAEHAIKETRKMINTKSWTKIKLVLQLNLSII